MVSLGNIKLNAGLGIILTASHNPPSYGGFKIKADFGGPLQPELVQEIEDAIPSSCPINTDGLTIEQYLSIGMVEYVDLETMYVKQIEANFDLEAIKKSGLVFGFDAMYGSGQNVMKRVLPDVISLHCEHNPSFMVKHQSLLQKI